VFSIDSLLQYHRDMQYSGPEGYAPDEGGGGAVSEQASEQAREQFAAAQAAVQQARRDEQKSKKRDDDVAQAILQFLTDEQRSHFALLIARLVSRDCPSPFLLALLSLISPRCRDAVDEYLHEHGSDPQSAPTDTQIMPENTTLPPDANDALARWMVRLDQVMTLDAERVLHTLLVDEGNIDGTVLQIAAFVLRDFLAEHGREVSYEQVKGPAAAILQTLFRPIMQVWQEQKLQDEQQP
jgi:hypothetical protein